MKCDLTDVGSNGDDKRTHEFRRVGVGLIESAPVDMGYSTGKMC